MSSGGCAGIVCCALRSHHTNMPIVETRLAELEVLCRRYDVARLELFGSAATGRFDPLTSDLDFLVTFTKDGQRRVFENLMDLRQALQDLFNRPVDLLTRDSLSNPVMAAEIARTAKDIYGGQD
jgi:uncharacterized protein